MSGNFAIKGGGVGRLMANAILNFHFDYLNPSLIAPLDYEIICRQTIYIKDRLLNPLTVVEPDKY